MDRKRVEILHFRRGQQRAQRRASEVEERPADDALIGDFAAIAKSFDEERHGQFAAVAQSLEAVAVSALAVREAVDVFLDRVGIARAGVVALIEDDDQLVGHVLHRVQVLPSQQPLIQVVLAIIGGLLKCREDFDRLRAAGENFIPFGSRQVIAGDLAVVPEII